MNLMSILRLHVEDDDLLVHNSEEIERLLFSLVEHGKTEEIAKFFENFDSIEADIGIVANTPLRSQKNIFIVATTFISRAAVRGGMDYESAMTMSDAYLQKMEELDTYDDVFELMIKMALNYASIVQDIRKLSVNSRIVSKTCNYIAQNLYNKVTVAQISENLSVNKSYLSTHFKKTTGISLANYINGQKINEAEFLLTSTQKTIIEISEALEFSSQSYFHTVFMKFTGMTPLMYRNLKKII